MSEIRKCSLCGVGVMWRNGHPVQYHDCEEDKKCLESGGNHSSAYQLALKTEEVLDILKVAGLLANIEKSQPGYEAEIRGLILRVKSLELP